MRVDLQLSRRTFVAAVGAGALAPMALAGLAPKQPAPPKRILKSLKFGMIKDGQSIRDKFEIALGAGFDGVEMDSPSDLDLDIILRAKEATAIQIPGVVDSAHWSQPLSDPSQEVRSAGRGALGTAIHDCKAIGGTTVLLVPAVVNAEVSPADAWRRSMRELEQIAPIASKAGVGIAFENVWNNFLLSPSAAARYVDEANTFTPEGASPVFSWYFDIGNIWRYGWPQHWIRELGGRISKLDVKGYSRAKADKEGKWAGFGVEVDEDDLPWDQVNRALDEIGYRGWASAEVGGGDRARLKDISRRMDRVFTR